MAMAHKVAYLVKVYNVPMCLVVNIDQTRVHLVPIKGDQTWETRKAKHVQVLGIEDKRQITTIISSSTKGHCYLCKLCFKGQQIIHSHPWIMEKNNVIQLVSILPLVPIIGPIWKPLKHLLNTSSYPTRRITWRSLPY
jgi:hypothetical protein